MAPGSEDAEESEDPVRAEEAGEKKGQSTAGTSSAVDATMLLLVERSEKEAICTGSLIAPDLILTARHCVAEQTRGEDGCFTFDETVGVSRITIKTGATVRGSSPLVAQAKEIRFPEDHVSCMPDIAVIKLDRSVTTLRPVALAEGAPRVGAKCTKAGYSPTFAPELDDEEEWAYEEVEADRGVPLRQRNTRSLEVIAVGASEQTYRDKTGKTRRHHLRANELATGTGICGGDSGGPLFDSSGRQTGIVSRQPPDASCLDAPSIFVSVAAHHTWLQAQIAD